MKKLLVSSALILSLVTAGVASANWHREAGGYHKKYGGQAANVQLSEEDREKFLAFQKETVDIRRDLFIKRAEERVMLKMDNPDPAEAAKLSGEIFDLKTSLKEKAESAGIERTLREGRGGTVIKGGGKNRINLDQATIEKVESFKNENSADYKEIAMKKAEQRAIMKGENVDPAKAAEIAGELFDMRLALQEKAEAAGVPYYAMMGKRGDKMNKWGGRKDKMGSGPHRNGWGW